MRQRTSRQISRLVARALYKLGRIDESRKAFKEILNSQPPIRLEGSLWGAVRGQFNICYRCHGMYVPRPDKDAVSGDDEHHYHDWCLR